MKFISQLKNRLWQKIVRNMARAHGFIDPVYLFSRLNQFARPSEVMVPVEVMRIGVVMNARGAVNSQAIQHNLDWIWPFWVNRQFDPRCESFIPRAFSLTHINLTHRNWTAVGLPDETELPIIDPRGLVTPHYDGWSIDAWIVGENGEALIPSRARDCHQTWDWSEGLAVVSKTGSARHEMTSTVDMVLDGDLPVCRVTYDFLSREDAWAAVSLRPDNPEGISFINKIEWSAEDGVWEIDGHQRVYLDPRPAKGLLSTYHRGDVFHQLFSGTPERKVSCEVGMATGAALYHLQAGRPLRVRVYVPLSKNSELKDRARLIAGSERWKKATEPAAGIVLAEKRIQYLTEAALRSLILHAGEDVFPGPYTYKYFWFRDAVFIANALLTAGCRDRVRKIIDIFLSRQKSNGYFCSQDGEWDSNGQVLWFLNRYCQLTGEDPPREWEHAVRNGLKWIFRKRLSQKEESPHAGLFPTGFSAEHFGPSDYYYWDDFWGVAGLRAGASILERWGDSEEAARCSREAEDFTRCIENSLKTAAERLGTQAMPSSPYRRLDSASIGSLVCGYPLRQFSPNDGRVLQTTEYLLKECFLEKGFFHDMSHSGINPYLTLYVAQILLRSGDMRFSALLNRTADLATPTGQWPEAVHPGTEGGCMGDGHHCWASAEWLLMVRDCFVREEDDVLILCSGVLPEWYGAGETRFGPVLTEFGRLSLTLKQTNDGVEVAWNAKWHASLPKIIVALPGYPRREAGSEETAILITPEK